MRERRGARWLVAAALLALAWTLAIAAAGRVDLRPLGLPVVASTPWPPLGAAMLALLLHAAWRGSRGARILGDLDALLPPPAAARALAALLAVGVVALTIRFNTFTAGGSDSYCYVEQAERWAAGRVREPIAPGFDTPWRHATLSLVPTGFVPAEAVAGAMAPICPPGLALLMAVPRAAGAPPWSVFLVVPALAGLTVWAAFLLGGRLVGAGGGLAAAALVAASPIFLYQAVQPMSDVPATAWWTLALAAALRPAGGAPLRAGLFAGLAIAMRPNLLPAVVPFLVTAAWPGAPASHERAIARRRLAIVLAGLVPGLAVVGATQWYLYGSPLRSGYGSLALLFDLSHVATNLARYPRWLVETHSWLVVAGVLAPVCFCGRRGNGRGAAHPPADETGTRERCRHVLLIAAFAAIVVASYLPYVPFDGWWFLRFWLPAIPPLVILSVAVVQTAAARWLRGVRPGVRVLAGALATVTLAAWMLGVARDRAVFDLQRFERKFLLTADHVARHLPADAVLLAVWHSGSLRYHAGRMTILWDALEPSDLDVVVSALRREGRPVFLVLEDWERERFQRRFGGASALAALDWPPRARIRHEVTVWSVDDRERYLRGEAVVTAVVGDRSPGSR